MGDGRSTGFFSADLGFINDKRLKAGFVRFRSKFAEGINGS